MITENLEIGNWVETRQNCLILSAVVFTPPTWTRQDSFVLSCQLCEISITGNSNSENTYKHTAVGCCTYKPICQCNCMKQLLGHVFTDRDEKKLIQTGSRQDKTVLVCLVCSYIHTTDIDKTVLSCPCRQFAQAISVELYLRPYTFAGHVVAMWQVSPCSCLSDSHAVSTDPRWHC